MDEEALKNLDERATDAEDYQLVVVIEPESMRGVDYRAPVMGILLLVGRSFCNIRDADQGLKRVGRKGDPC